MTPNAPLYDPRFEHDACGVGFVVRARGRRDPTVLPMALTALERLAHRGAVAADGTSSDGVGVLTQIPRRLLLREASKLGWSLGADERFGVAMLFVDTDDEGPAEVLAATLRAEGLRPVGVREVPVDRSVLGASALATLPRVRQLVATAPAGVTDDELERRLHSARKSFEREAPGGYVCSLSCRTIVYKALCAGGLLARFYPDLADPHFETSLAVFHQRYSTNTEPRWRLAQPLRLLAHNGEINTLWANRAWMRAREPDLPPGLRPVLDETGSDSTSLDEALELLVRGGRALDHALRMLIVPAWERAASLDPGAAAFHRYHAPLMEPWDGPAALAFSDGCLVGAALDRNGLRPCRYVVCDDGLVVAGSEVGLFDLDDGRVLEKGRLGPGQMLMVDLARGRVLHDGEIRERLLSSRAWAAGLGGRALHRDADADAGEGAIDLTARQDLFGFTAEDLRFVLTPMAEDGKESTWSMGDDTPIPALARSPRSLYTFLRQRFAQVTNPPIDPLREASVMSLRTWLGPRPGPLADGPQPPVLELDSPVLSSADLAGLRNQDDLAVSPVDCTFDPGTTRLPDALEEICARAERAVRGGAALVILTDREADPRTPVPMALAVGAVHHHLLRAGLRARADLVTEAGDCWDVHHVAVLLGYGAGAACPWLALASARAVRPDGGDHELVRALELGLLKVLSKMGISTVSSYRAGQLFEVVGLSDEVVERCFRGTPSRIGGLGWEALGRSLVARRTGALAAEASPVRLPDYGRVRYRRGDQAEAHAWQPSAVRALQRAVGSARGESVPRAGAWDEFTRLASGDAPSNLRDLLDFVAAGPALPLAAIEPADAIVRRFVVSAMSLGALSPEAHGTLTLAMNRLGARSNTGEGGEDPALYRRTERGERADSKVKQVASGRFGVTVEYLARADELEIKIAQGSKPGEGGQLPGHKVTDLIARLRHAQPGHALISPPPHHDIYSIEDLAQLIYDLKRCNPRAAVGVKLVSEAGVGTIAAGVAKAWAHYVVISGHDGGTGASPLSSIKHAGTPWEMGLAETQQVLLRHGMRGRIRVRVDGGLMNASDVLVAALLGAEEFGFGTAPLVALGCDMARRCHLNTCPTGIATQDPELRAKFRGRPEQVERFFRLLAEDLRRLLALLGLRSVADAVGRVDLLRQVRFDGGLDLSALLARVEGDALRCATTGSDRPGEQEPFEDGWVRDVLPELARGRTVRAERVVRNSDRTVGARISGEIARRWGGSGLPPGSVVLRCMGSAGQSFGAFGAPGLLLELTGEANDYVGKGLSGADLVLRPTGPAAREPHRHVILGNVALYGATSGRLFAAGCAGERFAVRNSGALAVVEGAGDHACEYMTGGVVVVLGPTGVNVGAGMTGGEAFVYDEDGALPSRLNTDSVACARPRADELGRLRALVVEHVERTGSANATRLLAAWESTVAQMWRVAPV